MISEVDGLIETVFRTEYGQVLAVLISQFGDFLLAEDSLQDALLIALEKWSVAGIPQNPGAWLLVISRRRAVDKLRREFTFNQKLGFLVDQEDPHSIEQEPDEMATVPDERLKLMFTCCHPALALETQVALTLRTVCGLTTDEVARAFLVPVATMTKRLTRAKLKIREARIPFCIPSAHILPERLDALLAVIYLIFTEGYCATRGAELIRHDLCSEAIRLIRILLDQFPQGEKAAEAQGLLALLLLHDSRRDARISLSGELVLLEDQDRGAWNQEQIEEGLALLEQALALKKPGPYQVQAAISALHVQAPTARDTDWQQIKVLYDILLGMSSNVVIQVNRAVAIGMIEGAQAGLQALTVIDDAQNYYPFHAAQADFLQRLNDFDAAAISYERATVLCQNEIERAYLSKRLMEVINKSNPP